jgi:PKD repeat protein
MKKVFFAIIALIAGQTQFAHAQEVCGSNVALLQELADPANRARYEDFQDALLRYTEDPRVADVRENGIRIIPVVFHILHDGGTENIGLNKVQQQLDVLNEDYSRTNPDTVNFPVRLIGDTEYTHFVFNSASIVDYVSPLSYIRVSNRYGVDFAFHFNNGSGNFSDSLAAFFDEVVEVNISNGDDTSDIAMALASAINSRAGLSAQYDNSEDDHRVKVATDGLGYVTDALQAGLWPITTILDQQGKYVPAACDIEFRLATKDPLGNCTDGVVRVLTSKTNDANNQTGFKAESYWNAYSYLNVWVVSNIDMEVEGGGMVLGYAQFPASGLLSTDGIAVIASNIDTRSSGGRTATHEVGHWLSLIHIWGDDQCGSDNVLDTPVHNGPNYGVCGNNPAFLGQFGGTSTNYSTPYNFPGCDPANPDGEMFSNYMDYSSDVCQNTFTLGQKDRMDFTLHGDGTGPGIRSYLISAENLELTGVADPYTQPDCAPISLFYFQQSGGFATQQMICAGESVNFEESVYNGTVDNYLWTFEGGNPATDTDPSPNVIYDNPGTYDVSLQVSNTAGSNTRTENDMVIVSSNTAQFQNDWGYVDSFYGESGFLSNYVVFNRDNSVNKWEWFTGLDGGSTGSESVRMVNLDNQTSEVDELISPSYDLSTVSNATLKFRYSGAAVDNTPSDELRIMASDDCGETWSLRETISGFDLCNAGLVNQSYVPNSQSPWMDFDVSLGSFSNNNNVRIKFRWISGGRSNNFYIDDITLSASPLGMEDLEQMIGLSIAPNPTSDMTSISLDLVDGSDVTMEVVDVLGRSVRSILSRELSSGNHRVDLDMSKFNVGIYYLRITVGNNLIVKKIVRN